MDKIEAELLKGLKNKYKDKRDEYLVVWMESKSLFVDVIDWVKNGFVRVVDKVKQGDFKGVKSVVGQIFNVALEVITEGIIMSII